MTRENFLDDQFSIFSRDALELPRRGHRVHTDCLINQADRTMNVVRGVCAVMTITRANLVRECAMEHGSGNLEPPLAPATVEALLCLGIEAAKMLEGCIEDLSTGLDKQVEKYKEGGDDA
ncbi:hypothetical protein G3N58_25455 [Paraburkholderia sp. Ac-20342]|uniref:hypothetical protein n=1 Tax=Paraburkholderia sp. Ac-20342 TaxID=2703889 RepID=UPI00197D5D33|nr:hypothetical protein [Paraburkholderia sp. Ac-20342]MBN3850141.1 hypothetical protein [Paraburkholderia sp. Ac-20342]